MPPQLETFREGKKNRSRFRQKQYYEGREKSRNVGLCVIGSSFPRQGLTRYGRQFIEKNTEECIGNCINGDYSFPTDAPASATSALLVFPEKAA